MKQIIVILFACFFYQCSKKQDDLKQPELNNALPANIELLLQQDTLPADGKTYSQLTVRVSKTVLTYYQEASFEVSPVGKFNTGATSLKVPLDGNGEAKAFIASETAGLASIKVTVGRLVATGGVVFTPTTAPGSFKLLCLAKDLPADNATYAEVVAVSIPPSSLQLVFVTDKGLFHNNSTTYTVQNTMNDSARAFIKHNKAEPVKVWCLLGGASTKELYLSFSPAWPEQILLTPAQVTVAPKYSSKIQLKAKLTRSTGAVTDNQIVSFTDSTASGSAGIFFNTVRSDLNGEATTEYWLQDTNFRGNVYIRATVSTPQGKVSGSSRLLIKN